jgi:hypothetical protein
MTEDEEIFLRILPLFDKQGQGYGTNGRDKFLNENVINQQVAGKDDFTDISSHEFGRYFTKMCNLEFITETREKGTNVRLLILSDIGRGKWEKLINKKIDSEIEKIQSKDEKALARLLHMSTLKTNNLTRINSRHQMLTGYLAIAVAIFASWTAYKQMIKDDEKNAKELLKEQNIIKIQSQIDSIKKSLKNVHVACHVDTLKKN